LIRAVKYTYIIAKQYYKIATNYDKSKLYLKAVNDVDIFSRPRSTCTWRFLILAYKSRPKQWI